MTQVAEKTAYDAVNPTAEAGKKSVDAIVISNQDKVFAQIQKLLDEKKYKWEKVNVEDFFSNRDDFEYIGTAIVETSAITDNQKKRICDIIRSLESSGVATVLINNHINFPVGNYDIVSVLETGSIEELRGHLTANITYHKKMAKVDDILEDQVSEELEEQLRMAGQVQKDFLPAKLPHTNQTRWAVLFHPADWVSGDIYDIRRLDEQHIGFYVADAVGHCMPAALLTIFIKQCLVMRETKGNDYRIFGPSEVLFNLNNKMVEQELSGSLFSTCCYCLLNIRTLQMTYARAGHPYPILIKHKGTPDLLQSRGGLLGVFKDAEFPHETIQLQKGDKLMLYSDGAESIIGSTQDDSKFAFNEDFTAITELNVERMLEMFDILIRNRTFSNAERDDITAVGLELT